MLAKKHKPYYTKEGYRQIFMPNSSEARDNGYAPEHRVVASKRLGRTLYDDEVVHHRDGNKRNNRPSNLQVMSRSMHWKKHHKKRNKVV